MSEIKVNVKENDLDNTEVPVENSLMPSVHGAKISAYRTCPRKNLSIAQIPVFIMEDFEKMAKSRGLTKKQFFYQMLRDSGVDIPPYNEIHKSGGF